MFQIFLAKNAKPAKKRFYIIIKKERRSLTKTQRVLKGSRLRGVEVSRVTISELAGWTVGQFNIQFKDINPTSCTQKCDFGLRTSDFLYKRNKHYELNRLFIH